MEFYVISKIFTIGCITLLINPLKYSLYNLETINKHPSHFASKKRHHKETVSFCIIEFKCSRVDGEKIVLMKFRRIAVLKRDIKEIKKASNMGVLQEITIGN